MVISKDTIKNWLNFIFIVIIVSLVYSNAKIGFSYDYQYYFSYIREIIPLSFSELNEIRSGVYFYLRKSAGIEPGFVILTKFISLITQDETAVYAIIAVFSIALKVITLRSFGVAWYWIYIVCLYSGVLLESNALRSGLSLTLFMLGLLAFDKKYKGLFVMLFIASLLFHVQAILFILLFLLFTFFERLSLFNNLKNVSLTFILSMTFGVVINWLLGVFLQGKFVVYTKKFSSSAGLSITSLIVILILFYFYVNIILNFNRDKQLNKTYKTRILMLVPVAAIYVTITSISALGDRLWQWGQILLVIFVTGYFKDRQDYKVTFQSLQFNVSTLLLGTLYCVILTGILFRYPLSNFLYPLTDYIDFSLIGFN